MCRIPNFCLRLRVKSLCHDLTYDIVPVFINRISQDMIAKLIVTNPQNK